MNYFDCHTDALTEISDDETLLSNGRDLDLTRVGAFAESYAQIFALWEDVARFPLEETDERFMACYQRAMGLLRDQSERVSLVRSAAEMHAALEAGLGAAFLSIEDVSFMGGHVDSLYELGFRFAMLCWNHDNRYACGAACDQRRGLTEEGRALVRSLDERGVVLDVSHLSDAGVEDLLGLVDGPVMASHSDVRDVAGRPRNLARWQVDEIVRRDGLIGLNFFAPFVGGDGLPTLDDLLRHADYVLEAGGEDVLALGADFDGSQGLFPEGVVGVQSMPDVRARFVSSLGEELAEKIFFGNAVSFVDRVL